MANGPLVFLASQLRLAIDYIHFYSSMIEYGNAHDRHCLNTIGSDNVS